MAAQLRAPRRMNRDLDLVARLFANANDLGNPFSVSELESRTGGGLIATSKALGVLCMTCSWRLLLKARRRARSGAQVGSAGETFGGLPL